MRSLSARSDVGAVGALLLYDDDDRVQHAGVILGFNQGAEHAMKHCPAYLDAERRHRTPGYESNLIVVRDCSAVTAACIMIPHAVFKQVGGFDEGFVVGFNDTDLCLRIVAAGFKVLYDGFTVLRHRESATRAAQQNLDHPEDGRLLHDRWHSVLAAGDPFYNPALTQSGRDHILRHDSGCKGHMQPRTVQLRAAPQQKTGSKPRRRPAANSA